MGPRFVPDPAPPEGLESLMSRYQQADEDAAAALIGQVTPLLRRYFLVQASNRRYADDLLQETWMRIHRARHTYRRGEPVLPWIFAIARYSGLDYYRKARRRETRERQVAVFPEAAQPAPARENGPDIDTMLSALPGPQREVIVMLKISGMTIDDVARATSSSAGSVKQKAHRAYRKLREILTTAGRTE
jgi:RNA polymerase sigma-70 factor (ECF subfamily)